MTKTRDSLAFAVDALVIPWNHFCLIHTYLLVQILPQLLCRIEVEVALVILMHQTAPGELIARNYSDSREYLWHFWTDPICCFDESMF